MDGSEPGESVAAAVLSGAPVDLQARQVRYGFLCECTYTLKTDFVQHLQARQDRHTVRKLDVGTLAHGLGCARQGPPMGEPSHGLGIVCRLHERTPTPVQVQAGCYQLCQQAGLRVLCPGAQRSQVRSQGIRQQLHTRPRKVEAGQDKVKRCGGDDLSRVNTGLGVPFVCRCSAESLALT